MAGDPYSERQLKRWTRPDAHRFIRPDWRRFVVPGSDLARLYEDIERKYSPNQPRVPAGSSDGGQWTSEGGGGASSRQTAANMKPRTRYAQVIRVCIASGRALFTDPVSGYKSHTVTYDCAGGRSVTHSGPGHSFPGIIPDPYH
jgi:hypothetical protein